MNNLLNDFLKNLNLNHEEIVVFSILCQKGPSTILNLSRYTNINRTRIYRLVEKLKKQRLVEELVDEHRIIIKAVNPHQLGLLIKEQENKTNFLKDNLTQVTDLINLSQASIQPGTKVLFYRGVDGIKQMVWNNLQAKKEVVGYTYRQVNEFVGNKFIENWRGEFIKRNLFFRDIFSDQYIDSLSLLNKNKLKLSHPHFESRYLPTKILNVNHQIDIYNDVIGFYNWHEGEIFGIEIYNGKIATMQKQLFEIVWTQAKKSLIKEK